MSLLALLIDCSLFMVSMVLSYTQGSNGCSRNGDQKGILEGVVTIVKHFTLTPVHLAGSQLAYWPYVH